MLILSLLQNLGKHFFVMYMIYNLTMRVRKLSIVSSKSNQSDGRYINHKPLTVIIPNKVS